jgi:hypothetical protein
MKRSFLFVLSVSTLLLAYACSKSDEPKKEEEERPLVTAPEAVVAHDGKSGGVYKGVIIGSTGTVKIILQGGTVSAEVTIDGETKVLAPQNLPSGWISGQPLKEIVFASGNWTLTFSVAANGEHSHVSSVSLPGHTDVVVCIVKEQSTTLVRAFEGSYSTGDAVFAGTINFVLRSPGDSVFGVIQRQLTGLKYLGLGHYRLDSGKEFVSQNGSLSGNAGFYFEGDLKDDEINGTWTMDSSFSKPAGGWGEVVIGSGNWKAKRTL